MIHRDNGSRSHGRFTNRQAPRIPARRSWIIASFGFLVAGLVGGTIMFVWEPDWVWPVPAAGFVGYLLAFRRGMLLWSPNIDMTWREYLWLDRDPTAIRRWPARRRQG